MDSNGLVRWGILGTANIARASFLPGLREAGGGEAAVVGGRDPVGAAVWAAAQGVASAVEGYDRVLEDPTVDAVYVALPNTLHAVWTERALGAGKAVLTEKPLCLSVEETTAVLAAAAPHGALLWEAFVFPFHPQMARVAALVAAGAIGELREIQSDFHFPVRSQTNIRMRPELGGGALNDVGCYPVHLACRLFGPDGPGAARALSRPAPTGVDLETQGALLFAGGRTLLFSCGMARAYDTATRLLGTEGEIRMDNPFHPTPASLVEIRRAGEAPVVERPTIHSRSFAPAIAHIHAVLRGEAAPEHLAREEALATAQALAALRLAGRTRE